jgi:rSAM/selenodomain-associated transferase 2
MAQASAPAAIQLADLAVIVPVLNRRRDLEATLHALPQVGEVIVVDGGSTDGSAQVARDHGAAVLACAPGRGGQFRAGAERAASSWLLFVHADTRLDGAAWGAIGRTLREGNASRAATFRFRLDDHAWQARLLELGVRLRVRLLALPYGDQGLLIHRSLYQQVGGYRDMPLMEDVDLARRLGRRRLARLDGTATTSAERWRRRGWARQSLANLGCLLLYMLGVSAERIARMRG